MKISHRLLSKVILTGFLVLVGSDIRANPFVYTLSSGNATASINLVSQAGMYDWKINGYDQLSQQWFWYRAGTDAQEYSLDTLTLTGATPFGSNGLSASYAHPNFTVSLTYVLTGGTPSTGNAHLTESITINNTSSSTLDLHFFQYSDFDLLGSLNDTAALGRNVSGNFNEALQAEGGLLGPNFSETVDSPGASRGEVALFPYLLNELNDGLPTTLSNFVGPVGPGDCTWALQWDFTLGAGESRLISKVKNLQIPEPSAVALLALGIAGLAVRRWSGNSAERSQS